MRVIILEIIIFLKNTKNKMEKDIFYKILKDSILIREVEQRLLDLFKQGLMNGTIHTCVGQELIPSVLSNFILESDFYLSNHRGHGHYITKTKDVAGLFSELMGRKTGCCGGIGGSQHLFNVNFISNGIQGGMTAIGAGISFGFKFKKLNNIAVVFIGDGTLGEGLLYETLNICGVWNLPILFILENNGYAQSTCTKMTFSGDLKKRIEGFNVHYLKSDIWNIEHLSKTLNTAVNSARSLKPTFVEIKCYRLNPHSKGDDNRDVKEVSEYFKKDPIIRFAKSEPEIYKKFLNESKYIIDESVAAALNAETLENIKNYKNYTNIISEISPLITDEDKSRINDRIYRVLKNLMNNNNYILLGEDIHYTTKYTSKPYGGAFNVTRDLSERFPERVISTPISEAAIVGLGIGLSIIGFIPIVEIMFGDFLTLVFDQIYNHVSKFFIISNPKINIPLIIRTPMGGRRGYGPTHSQSIEKFLLGIPNIKVVALNNRLAPEKIYNSIKNNLDKPYFVIENKLLYTKEVNRSLINGYQIFKTNEDFPTIIIKPKRGEPQLTIFCYGQMLEEVEIAAEELFFEEEILVEIICPTLIYPINIYPILNSVRITKKILTVEEGPYTAALSSEIISIILEENCEIQTVKRLGNNTIVPSSTEAELNLLPSSKSIYESVINILKGESKC